MQIWQKFWKALDPTGTGCISAEEFHKFDTDGDGALSRDDIRSAVENVARLETYEGQDIVVNQLIQEVQQFNETPADAEGAEATVPQNTLQQAYKHWSSSSLASLGGDITSSDEEA